MAIRRYLITIILLLTAGVVLSYNFDAAGVVALFGFIMWFITTLADEYLQNPENRLYIITILLFTIALFSIPYSYIIPSLYAISALIFLVAAASFDNRGNNNRVYSTESDRVRDIYNKRLEKFYKKHTPRLELNNENVRLKLIVGKKNLATFYCIDKTDKSNELRHFIWLSNNKTCSDEAMTFWGFVDMEFNKNTSYDDILKLYDTLGFNQRIIQSKRTKPIKTGWYALYFIKNDTPYIICSKLNTKRSTLKNDYFTIKGNIAILYDIYYTVNFEHMYTKYETLTDILSKRTDCTIEQFQYQPKEKNKKFKHDKNKYNKNKNLLDINIAMAPEFARLPGVNIILAKRIVQKREEINGFKNKKEFYEFCKLKPHFIEQIDKLITVGKFDILEVILREDELMVDLVDDYDKDDDDNDLDDESDNITVDL